LPFPNPALGVCLRVDSYRVGMVARRTLITTASVAGVVVAGAAVVGANIRILDSAAAEDVGLLSATTVPLVEEVDVSVGPDEERSYAVEAAGTVSVERWGGELRLGAVSVTPGWTHEVSQQDATMILLTFSDGNTTYRFLATLDPDGAIAAGVSQPIDEVVVVQGAPDPTAGQGSAAPSPGAPAVGQAPPAQSAPSTGGSPDATAPPSRSSTQSSGEYEYEDHDEYEHDEYESEEHESEEREGGEDDD
jgi:hypothetical protein